MFNEIVNNNYYLASLIAVALIATEIVFARQRLFYHNDFGKDPKMRGHFLNTRYQLFTTPNLDVDKINTRIASAHIICAIGSALLMAFVDLVTGFGSYFLSSLVCTYGLYIYFGKKPPVFIPGPSVSGRIEVKSTPKKGRKKKRV